MSGEFMLKNSRQQQPRWRPWRPPQALLVPTVCNAPAWVKAGLPVGLAALSASSASLPELLLEAGRHCDLAPAMLLWRAPWEGGRVCAVLPGASGSAPHTSSRGRAQAGKRPWASAWSVCTGTSCARTILQLRACQIHPTSPTAVCQWQGSEGQPAAVTRATPDVVHLCSPACPVV